MTKKIIGLGITFILVFFAIGFAACELPDAGFAEYQAAAVSSLEEYVDALNEDDFNAENWTQIQNYLEDGIKAVNAATNRAEVRYARDTAKEAIGAVESRVAFKYHSFRGATTIPIFWFELMDIQQLNNYLASNREGFPTFIKYYLEFLQENYTKGFFDTHYILIVRVAGFPDDRFKITEISDDKTIYIVTIHGQLITLAFWNIIIEIPRTFAQNSFQINFNGTYHRR